MATGWTRAQLDELAAIMESATPPPPSKYDKWEAVRISAARAAGTDKGALFIFEAGNGSKAIYWLHCWVAKELAGAINIASQNYGWWKRKFLPDPDENLRYPQPDDLSLAGEDISLSTYADPGGIIVRFAVGENATPHTMFFPVRTALETMRSITTGGESAGWWDKDFELIPSRDSQH